MARNNVGRRNLRMLLCVAIIFLWSTCGPIPGPKPTIVLPAAETPVLETILDIDARQLIPFNPAGEYYRVTTAPLNRMYLRLRAPWPTDLNVSIEGTSLPIVTDTASHPE